ncbi:MAG: putative peroxiredoxin bcp [Alphaproteobacteria bacterium MarineAlpha5_Bin9]|nr:MAG: putative peroxiredoxin bcp [Alphaproteobacteria bacterium MarineAlpha5_Bin9]|tara:strand:+ start:4890 stop:5444 length:555 start_codon:yes stop_codon:yes gene_type:complete
MNFNNLPRDLPIPKDDGTANHLEGSFVPDIELPNQDGNYLKLSRKDSFRLVLFCYPMTGIPNKPSPEKWDLIPGARGCTPQNCSFRDNYDDLIINNSIPVGLTTQSVDEIKEMTLRLKIPYDVLSDANFKFIKALKIPTFKVDKTIFVKRITFIIQNSYIEKVFYPIFPPDRNVKDVINWLKEN